MEKEKEKNDKISNVIYGIIVLVLLFFLWYILYIINKNSKIILPTSDTNNIQNNKDLIQNALFDKCPNGYCATNIMTGIKRCPESVDNTMSYQVGLEVCNPKYSCTDKSTPYALNSTGEVNISGKCESDFFPCRCVNYISAPYYSTVYFKMENGSAYQKTSEYENYTLTQLPINSAISNPGRAQFSIGDPSSEFFRINPAYLRRITNACDFYDDTLTNITSEPTPFSMLKCIVDNNPCIQGQMSYNVDNKNSRDFCNFYSIGDKYLDDPVFYTVGCSIGNGCQALDPSSPTFEEDKKLFFPDYDEKAFNVPWYGKTLSSLYYPVFNTNTYRQECMRCNPLLITKLNFNNSNQISSIDIIFSGRDFLYVKPIMMTIPDIGQQFQVDETDSENRITSITPLNSNNFTYLPPINLIYMKIKTLTTWE